MFERKKSAGKIYALPIESIQPSPFQARTNFNEQELAGLAASIRENSRPFFDASISSALKFSGLL